MAVKYDPKAGYQTTGNFNVDVANSKSLAKAPNLVSEFSKQSPEIQASFKQVFGNDAASNWAAQHASHLVNTGEEGGGGGGGGGGSNNDYKKIDLYSPIRQAILRDLRMPNFDANDLDKRLNQSIEGVRLEAMGNRRSIAENMFGSGSYGISGKAASKFKEVGQAENQDINAKIQQLIQDERDYVQKQYDRGLGAATSLFNSTLNAQTAQNIAEANRKFQADLLAQQTAFAAEQAGLDRALQKYAIDQSVNNAGKGSGGQVLSGIISGLSSGGISLPTGSGSKNKPVAGVPVSPPSKR